MATPNSSAPVTSPLRLLILTPAPPSTTQPPFPSPIAPLLTALTGSAPSPEQIASGLAGYTTHAPLQLRTKYYNASIGIWCDEVVGNEWKENMAGLGEEAREVRGAVGGVVVVFDTGAKGVGGGRGEVEVGKDMDLLEQVEEVRALCEDEGGGREVVGVVVLVGEEAEARVDQLEEVLRGERGLFGWDVVGWNGDVEALEGEEAKGKNSYGEKVGVERLKEIFEAVPWTTTTSGPDQEDFLDGDDDVDWTTSEQRELDKEMMGLKMGLHDADGEDESEGKGEIFGEDEWPELQDNGSEDVKVEKLQGLMERLIATREAASELTGTEKQKFAKREVERIMKEMG